MAFTTIPSANIAVGKALKHELLSTYIKDSLDDHETRTLALETGANKVIVFNKIIERPPSAGDICYSYLTEAEFQTRYGTDWILADGDSIVGSDLASLRTWTTVPDSRGRFLRMKDNGASVDAGGERDLGNNQTGANLAHTHIPTTQNGRPLAFGFSGADNQTVDYSADPYGISTGTGGSATAWANTTSNGSESRPVNTAVNIFVRINDGSETGIEIWRAPAGFSIISAICTTLTAGTAGSLEVDVQKGSSLGSMASIFSTLPSNAYTDGNNFSSTNAVISSAAISLNDWIRLDISSLQTNQTRFHMYLIGELN